VNFLRWAAGLTADARENASAHGDNRSPLKVFLNLPEENVSDLRAAVFVEMRTTVKKSATDLHR